MESKIKSNIIKLYLLQIIRWGMFQMPIFVLFLQDNGLSLSQVLLLQSIFSIAIVLFEVPSGYISDKMGRKKTLVIGSILSFLGSLSYVFSYNFWGFLGAELLLGFGASFISGTDSALLYDSLKDLKLENSYKKKEGILQSMGNFSEGIASIIGGLLALSSLRSPFIVHCIFLFLAIFISLSIYEPKQQTKQKHSNPFKEIISIVKYSLHDHKEIKSLILYSGLIGAATLNITFFIQPYFQLVNLPLSMYGFLWAILNFSVGIFSLLANQYELFLGRKKSLISLIILVILGYTTLALTDSIWGIGFIFIFYLIRGTNGPIIKDYINQIIPSNIRATVLSVKNLSSRIIFSILSPFIGYIADIYSLQTALLTSAGFFAFNGLLAILFLKKHKAL